ncbi:MAG: hypothetical protein KC505_02150 [Myxococcales bacterium]|nr:hypothetical protein [Myxococcales bacterium]USN51330.1 MAG: hypothetical protein H6731_02680 [Myxococcales bacterium]
MKTRNIMTLLIFLLAFSFQTWTEDFSLENARWSLGGDASFIFRTNFDAIANLELSLKPAFSTIFHNKWELGIRPLINWTILKNIPVANRVEWGLHTYIRRYFLIHNNIYYYIGGNLGARIFDQDEQTFKISFGLENGILIGLAKSIALDVGIPINALFNNAYGFSYLEMPMGYLGIKAFF